MYETISTFAETATSSDFFAGGLALAVFGTAVAVLRLVYGRIKTAIWRRFAVTVSIDNRSAVFRHFSLWLAENQVLTHTRDWRTARGYDDSLRLLPGEGRHWFIRDRVFCLLGSHMDEKAKVTTNGHEQDPLETLSVTLIGAGVEQLEAWVAEGVAIAQARRRIGPELFVYRWDNWHSVGQVPRRSLDTLVTEHGQAERLRDDLKRFLSQQHWYAERGVPWRRGYLLHGPPGTGKTSLIRAVASDLDRDIATLDVGRSKLSDEDLREAMFDAPRRAVLVIEDIDAVFKGRDGDHDGVSFSGLLNAIDGVGAQEGRALFMTTNHIERLDPALIRPGRADLHIELGLIGARSAAEIFRRFFPNHEDQAVVFAANLDGCHVSPAQVQGWLLAHADDAVTASSAVGLLPKALTVAAE